MADLLDRLVARSRAPVPAPRGPRGPSFTVEDHVVVAQTPAATAAAAPATPASVPTGPATPAMSPAGTVPAPSREPGPTVVRVEVAEPLAPAAVGPAPRAATEPAEVVRVAPPGPVSPPSVQSTSILPSRPRLEPDRQPTTRERVVERAVEARTDLRTEVLTESRTERVTVVEPQVARPSTATPPPLAVPTRPVVPGADQAPPAVHIHIGRLDVRGADEPAPAATGASTPAAPAAAAAAVLSLGDYLHGRAQARS